MDPQIFHKGVQRTPKFENLDTSLEPLSIQYLGIRPITDEWMKVLSISGPPVGGTLYVGTYYIVTVGRYRIGWNLYADHTNEAFSVLGWTTLPLILFFFFFFFCRRELKPAEDITPEERDARTAFCMQLARNIRPRDLEEFFSKVGQVSHQCNVQLVNNFQCKVPVKNLWIYYFAFFR